MDTVLHRIEALPGTGRYAVTFRRADGSEQPATVEFDGDEVTVAAASLPHDWPRDGDAFRAMAAAVAAFHTARRLGPAVAALHDPEGGWDVSLGNVVLGDGGVPRCIAHGVMSAVGATFTCAECGAVALLG